MPSTLKRNCRLDDVQEPTTLSEPDPPTAGFWCGGRTAAGRNATIQGRWVIALVLGMLLPLVACSPRFVLAQAEGGEATVDRESDGKTNRDGGAQETRYLRVFVLAGQSNMEGQAVVDLDHPQHYNGGRGTLARLLQSPEHVGRMGHLRDANGRWATRDDVWVRFQTAQRLKRGPLSIGFAGYDDLHHFGPELQFGHVVGDALDDPVLIVKTAWGGKSLFQDFRPPSSGGTTGPYYRRMVDEVRQAIEHHAEDFPETAGAIPELAGFVWFQGWNDMIDEQARAEYEQNLVNLIKDFRKEFRSPLLPVVVGELGNGGPEASEPMRQIREAQRRACQRPEFNSLVSFVPTARFARPAEQSPNVTHGHHWFGNAESYFLIGDALGHQMLKLLGEEPGLPRVLLLGDSISIGYWPTVRDELDGQALVIRPMNTTTRPENCQGTTYGVANIDRWLRLAGGNWDIIHFNFGLHDLKHVDPETGRNSNRPDDPPQADLETYERQLRTIVDRLRATNARLIWATTTPVPEGVRPFRPIDAPQKYNAVAARIMEQHEIPTNDLFRLASERLDEIQRPRDVHFTPEGSRFLGRHVADVIRQALSRESR